MDVTVCMHKSENVVQSQYHFARTHVRLSVIFKNSVMGWQLKNKNQSSLSNVETLELRLNEVDNIILTFSVKTTKAKIFKCMVYQTKLYNSDHFTSQGVLMVDPNPIKPTATAAVKCAATATATLYKKQNKLQRKGTYPRSDIATFRLTWCPFLKISLH